MCDDVMMRRDKGLALVDSFANRGTVFGLQGGSSNGGCYFAPTWYLSGRAASKSTALRVCAWQSVTLRVSVLSLIIG